LTEGKTPVNSETALPAYSDDKLSALTISELVDLLARDEDRVPRNVIDECARRGDAMIDALGALLDSRDAWLPEGTNGEWWRLLHAAMILGLMPGESAGQLLMQTMRRIALEEDDNLQDWLSLHWPGFFANKPASLLPALRVINDDRSLGFYMRSCAAETLVFLAHRADAATLNENLDHLAAAIRDKADDRDYRMLVANLLLGHPRQRYREFLEKLAPTRPGLDTIFTRKDVMAAYARGTDQPDRGYAMNPWDFYAPEEIAHRQARWAEEDRKALARAERVETEDIDDLIYDEDHEFAEPYVRDHPKTGRNEPCPCGSGKKFKKCCHPKYENLP
jgi:hypothetical protein